LPQTIACFGSGSGQPGNAQYDAVQEAGRLLADRGCIVISGGFGGIGMEAPLRGAREGGARTAGYTFLGRPANDFAEITVDCSHSQVGNIPIVGNAVQWGTRLGNLLEDADGFIVAARGGKGTMIELLSALHLNDRLCSVPKPIAILQAGVEIPKSWDKSMLDQLEAWGLMKPEEAETICIAEMPETAVSWVCKD